LLTIAKNGGITDAVSARLRALDHRPGGGPLRMVRGGRGQATDQFGAGGAHRAVAVRIGRLRHHFSFELEQQALLTGYAQPWRLLLQYDEQALCLIDTHPAPPVAASAHRPRRARTGRRRWPSRP